MNSMLGNGIISLKGVQGKNVKAYSAESTEQTLALKIYFKKILKVTLTRGILNCKVAEPLTKSSNSC